MLQRIHANLFRQFKALGVLAALQGEEYSLLMGHKPQDITHLELSIHDLMHQLAVERQEIMDMLQGMKLAEYLEVVVPDDETQADDGAQTSDLRNTVRQLLAAIEEVEQACVKQARRNTELVLGLMDQGHNMLNWLHDQVVPKKTEAYSRRGVYANRRSEAALISGRL
jgi:hypothetical protein